MHILFLLLPKIENIELYFELFKLIYIIRTKTILELRHTFSFFKDFIFLFLREGKRGREEEKHQCVVAYFILPAGDLACNSVMCTNWESNQ